jgi:hypothetical protein
MEKRAPARRIWRRYFFHGEMCDESNSEMPREIICPDDVVIHTPFPWQAVQVNWEEPSRITPKPWQVGQVVVVKEKSLIVHGWTVPTHRR